MKTIFSLIGILFITNINAQKFDCAANTTSYQEFFKLRNIESAYDAWSEVRKNCPKYNETIYTDGIQIIQYKLDNTENAQEIETLVRDLMKLYDQYNKNFPSNSADFEVSKAMALYNNNIEATDEILNLLESGFTNAQDHITNPNSIYNYFKLCMDEYNAGEKKYNADFVLDKFIMVNTMLTKLQNSNTGNVESYKTVQRNIHSLAKELTTCENLVPFFEKKYEINKMNVSWLESALSTLSTKCSDRPIFNTLAQNFYAQKATPQSANFIALASLKQKKFEEAIKFYTEAADLETNPEAKAKIHYNLATGLLFGDKVKSKQNLTKALQYDPTMGNAYLFLAELYANAAETCGKTDFEKKAIYYLAIQTAKKASIADAKLKTTFESVEKKYALKSLTPTDIKNQKMNGKSLTIGCWINETVTFE